MSGELWENIPPWAIILAAARSGCFKQVHFIALASLIPSVLDRAVQCPGH